MLIPEMNEWRLDGKFIDLVMEVDGTKFPCHRVALATASNYFDVMLKETYWEGTSERIPLQKVINADTFGDVLEFIYTGTVPITMENVYDLLIAADYLELKPQLENDCTAFLMKNLPNQHMFNAAFFAKITERPVLLYHMVSYISCHLAEFYQTSDFLELPLEVIKLIIDVSTLREEIVVNAIMQWIYHKHEERWQCFSQLSCLGMMTCIHHRKIEFMAESLIPAGISNQDVISYLEELKGTSSDESLQIYWIFRDLLKHDVFGVFIHHTVDCKVVQLSDKCGGVKKVVYRDRSLYYSLNFFNDNHTLEWGFLEFCCHAADGTKLRTLTPPMTKTVYSYFVHNFRLSALPNIGQIYLYLAHSCSLKMYNCDTDEWSEIKLQKKVCWATMAACETRYTVYLVGGRMQDVHLLAYNCCTKKWRENLPTPKHKYSMGAAMCAFDGKLYLYDENCREYEIYDPSTNKWHASKPNPHIYATPAQSIVAYGDELWLFPNTIYTSLKDAHILFLYRPSSDSWRKYPVIMAVMERDKKSFDFGPRNSCFLDAFVL